MPILFDHVSAEVSPRSSGGEAPPNERAASPPARVEEQLRALLDAEQRRRERLSDQ
ncbi:hypothetical protein [Montanilutibacter psychrotolerans]|uniref:hypothetical protein n=1 Tax=Montanilutibacter psychrotolerans TaxID=1327343 RepID=UPI0016819BCA|nr:hypothetical protein [Lysobacter psychrotolerans]